jgi:hypothetical protein
MSDRQRAQIEADDRRAYDIKRDAERRNAVETAKTIVCL